MSVCRQVSPFVSIVIFLFLSGCDSIESSRYAPLMPYQGSVFSPSDADRVQQFLLSKDRPPKNVELEGGSFRIFGGNRLWHFWRPEFTFRSGSIPSPLSALQKFRLNRSSKDLKGLRVAIDPGHFGGDLAELEGKSVRLIRKDGKRSQVLLREGDLTLMTALALQRALTARGAEVFLTRTEIGGGALTESFESWLASRDRRDATSEKRETLFGEYHDLDLRERVRRINDFLPHVTLVLHYNHSRHFDRESRVSVLTDVNYNIVFVPGGFTDGELGDIDSRFELSRLMLSRDFEESKELALHAIAEMTDILGVPPYQNSTYPLANRIADGVFARNLALTRLVHGPVIYGETLFQNHFEEGRRLFERTAVLSGHAVSPRVLQVAKAYENAVLRWVDGN